MNLHSRCINRYNIVEKESDMKILALCSSNFKPQERTQIKTRAQTSYPRDLRNGAILKDTVSFGISNPTTEQKVLKTVKELFTALNENSNVKRTIEEELNAYAETATAVGKRINAEIYPVAKNLKMSPDMEKLGTFKSTEIWGSLEARALEFVQNAKNGKQLNALYSGVVTPQINMVTTTFSKQPLQKMAYFDFESNAKMFAVTRYKDSKMKDILESAERMSD